LRIITALIINWRAACILTSAMLRITYAKTESGQRWTLCGRLTGAWVNELRACWEHHHQPPASATEVVDLRDVTSIDESGEELLSEMRSGGASLVGSGVYTEHLLKNLRGETKECK